MTEADGSGEGDSPAVEKFETTGLLLGNGVGTLMGWGRIVVTLAGAAAATAVWAPAFVFAVLFVPVPAFVPICVVPIELPIELPSPPSGAAGDPSGLIADPGLRSSVYPDVCSDIRVRPGTRTTPEICPSLNGAGEVAAQGAVARGCADGGSGFIASAGSGSRRLRQTQ